MLFFFTSSRAELSENARRVVQRVSYELQESGRDSAGTLQVTILDGTGTSGSDILRFAIPLCVCGSNPIDSNGNVSRWGAPMQWGQSGCSTKYPLNNNLVDICHFPLGNPNNPQDISVSVSSVKVHLAHGDYIGVCGTCDPLAYNNKIIEYLMDGNGRLLHRILDSNGVVLSSDIFAEHLTDFQANFNAGQTVVSLSVSLAITASQSRTITSTKTIDVLLRNRG